MGTLHSGVTDRDDTLPIVDAQTGSELSLAVAPDSTDALRAAREEQYARTAKLARIDAAAKLGKTLRNLRQ
jgi:hypothetical protein